MKFFCKSNNIDFLIVLLGIVGTILCLCLAYLYSIPEAIHCFTNCQFVRESEYSSFLGISLPYLGIIFYSIITIYFVLILFIFKKKFIFKSYERYIVYLFITIGFVFSIYLTYIEAVILEAFCDYCLISAFIVTVIFVLYSIKLLLQVDRIKQN